MTAAEYRKGLTPQLKKKFGAATKGTTVDGVRFGTQLEARVYLWLKPQLRSDEKLLLQLRVPLISDCPRISPAGKTGWLTLDFAIVRAGVLGPFVPLAAEPTVPGTGGCCWHMRRAVDAKPKRRQAHSRDWRRGARAFLATYGFEIEEVEL